MYINLNSNNHNHTSNKIITIDKENKKRKQNIMNFKIFHLKYIKWRYRTVPVIDNIYFYFHPIGLPYF